MAPLGYESPLSTGYIKPRKKREVYVYVYTYKPMLIELNIKEEPSYPKARKDKRKNFNLS